MANTIIQLTDTPGSYSLSANKFLRVNNDANATEFWDIVLDYLGDVETTGAYAPSTGQTLVYSADSKWRPSTLDIYSAGNGINKSGLTLNVTAGASGGLLSNTSGVFIDDVSGLTAGTYGNASYVPVVTVNSKGQITTVTPTQITATQATTITNSFVGNVVGTSGQITVTGGTGNNSNATLTLPATGVTAATYGNATAIPQITVDTYGRIQNVDLVTVSGAAGSGNVTEAYKTISVSGQTNLAADSAEDTLTMAGAGGIEITTNAGTDTLTFTGNSTAIVSAVGAGTLSDVYTTGVANGESLIYVSANSRFEPGTVVTNLADSGVVAGAYGNGSVSARITVNAKGQITNATEVAIPQGDITSVVAGGGLAGGGTSGDVTLNLGQSGVSAGTYGNASVYPVITVDAYGRVTTVTTSSDGGGGGGIELTDLSVSTASASGSGSLAYNNGSGVFTFTPANLYSDSDVATYLAAQGYATKAVTVAEVTDSAPGALDTLNELAAAMGDDANFATTTATSLGNRLRIDVNNQGLDATQKSNAITNLGLHALATSGNYSDLGGKPTTIAGYGITDAFTGVYNTLTSRPTLTLVGDDLTYDGTTVDLSSVGGGGSGDIEGVTAGNGLSGGGASGTVALALDLNELSDTALSVANDSIPFIDVGDGSSKKELFADIVTAMAGSGLTATNGVLSRDAISLLALSDVGAEGTNGQVLTTDGAGSYTFTTPSGSGDITAVVAGTGLTGGATSGSATLNLGTSGASAGTYGNATYAPQITVDTYGRITGVTNVAISGGGGGGDITGVNITAGTGLSGTVTTTTGQHTQTLAVSGLTVAELAAGSLQLGSESFTDNDTSLMTSAAIQDKIESYGYTTESGDITGVTAGTGLSGGGTSGAVTLNMDATAVTAGTYGNASYTPQFTVNAQGQITGVTNVSISGGSASDTFKTISVSGQSDVVADSSNDTLTLVAGSNMTITTNAGSDQITLAASGGGGSGATIQRFKLNYDSSGNLDSTSDLTSLIDSATIDSASGGDCTITFDSSINYPPASIMIYGYDYSNNKYSLVPLETTMALREIAGGGSSGSPTLFNGSSSIALKLRLRETETGASRSFGVTTHAWIEFVVYD